MLVDNAALTLPAPSFEDFFNLDMASPAHSPLIASDSPDPFFNFYLDDDYSKPSNLPFDFLSAFSSSSPSSSSSLSPQSFSPFAIDPQLVASPLTSKSESEFGDEDDHSNDNDIEDDSAPKVIAPVKVAGLGKLRKGTVQSGGITKRSSTTVKDKENAVMSQVVRKPKDGMDDVDDGDDWRPSPEEYKKMSSKEKRQLRNKISARNFRVRRKEYISTLEGDIAERDRLLSAIRTELGSTQSENTALRQEITALKRALLAGRGTEDQPILPPPGPLPTTSPIASAPTPISIATSNLLTPNTQKDLASRNKAFWGGVGTGMGSGITSVHTALIPEITVGLGLGLSRKPLEGLMENLNPTLNGDAVGGGERKQKEMGVMGDGQMGGFEGFSDVNMFTLKTLDAYRMQLWGKMAAQTHAHQRSQTQAPTHPNTSNANANGTHLKGLASNLRPQYFHGSSVGLSGLLSGKNSSFQPHSYPYGAHNTSSSPPSSPVLPAGGANVPIISKVLSNSTNIPSSIPVADKSHVTPTPEQAVLAAMASQTLVKKLGCAFWEAFSGSGSGSGSSPVNGYRAWDAEKVRRVLEGKAVVRVVDVDAPSPSPPVPSLPVPGLAGGEKGIKKEEKDDQQNHMCCKKAIQDILEESMRSLSLGKKS